MAKDAGMKCITITSKHHDGFAMVDSQHTDSDIVDRTVYGRDVLAQLAWACREHGGWDAYIDFMNAQLT
jgi:alpha-L-fucosidase